MQIQLVQSPRTGDDVPVDMEGYVDEVTLSTTSSNGSSSSSSSSSVRSEPTTNFPHFSKINNTDCFQNTHYQTAENNNRTHVYRSSGRVLQHRCSFGNCCRDSRASNRHNRFSASAAAAASAVHRTPGTVANLPTTLNIPFDRQDLETTTATTTTTNSITTPHANDLNNDTSSFSCKVVLPTGLQQQGSSWSSHRVPNSSCCSSSSCSNSCSSSCSSFYSDSSSSFYSNFSSSSCSSSCSNCSSSTYSDSYSSSCSNSNLPSDNSNLRLQSSNSNSEVNDTRSEMLSRGVHAPRLPSSADPHQHLLLLQQQQQQQLQLQQQQKQLQALRVLPHYRKRAINYMMSHLQLRSNENDKSLEAVRKGIERLEGQVFNRANSKDQYVDLLAIKLGAIMERLYNCRTSRVSRPQLTNSHHHPQSACV